MRSLPLKLEPGSDLRLSIEKVGQIENSSGFVLGVVGNLSKAVFQCPGRKRPTVMEGNLEIITLNGTFSPSGVHLHLSLSDADCNVWGGHLEPGTLVLKGADILLSILENDEVDSSKSISSTGNLPPRVEIAVLPGCPWSHRAKRLLSSNEVPHSVLTIKSDSDFKQIQERSKMTTFPQIFIDGVLVGGYEELSKLVNERGCDQLR